MERFLENLHNYCADLVPFLGAICLIILIIILIKLVKLLESLDVTVRKTHGSIELVEKSLDKVQTPLDTTVKLAKTVDKAYDVGVKVVDETSEFISKNASNIKKKVNDYLTKDTSPKQEFIENEEYEYEEGE